MESKKKFEKNIFIEVLDDKSKKNTDINKSKSNSQNEKINDNKVDANKENDEIKIHRFFVFN